MAARRERNADVISERSHVDDLGDHVLWKLGRRLSEDNGDDCNWRWLASELGLDKNDIARIRSNPTDNPGYEVILCWSKRNDSSIRVLRNVLGDVLKRSDLVPTIDKARQNVVYLTVTLLCDGETVHNLSGHCSGSKPLMDFVRPKIHSIVASEVLSRQDQHSRLVITLYSVDDREWSSPAKLFQGRQVTLEKFVMKQRQESGSAKTRRHGERRPTVVRTAISQGCEIVFDVSHTDPLNPGRSTLLLDDVVENESAESFGHQEEGPEIQQTQEEDANASSAKVIANDDDQRL